MNSLDIFLLVLEMMNFDSDPFYDNSPSQSFSEILPLIFLHLERVYQMMKFAK